MSTEILRRTSPEEEELAQKREELALLQAKLADRELFLTNLRAELSALEGLYLRQCLKVMLAALSFQRNKSLWSAALDIVQSLESGEKCYSPKSCWEGKWRAQ